VCSSDLVLAFENNTAGAIDPASATYTVVFGRINADLLN
jgi:hypothetical protein